MWRRHWFSAFTLAGAAGCLFGCGKSDGPAPQEASSTPNAAVQMNLSGGPAPAVLGPENIKDQIDKAGAGVKLVKLDLSSVGLPLTVDAPEGAKAERDARAALLGEPVDVHISTDKGFALRIRLGKRLFEQRRRQLAVQKVLVNDKDLLLTESMLLLDTRCEFVRHVVVGLHDYCVENVDPLFGQQINHSQADCLLMLKCLNTLTPKLPPLADPVLALQQYNAAIVRGADGQVINLSLDPSQTTDATLSLVAKLPGLERLKLRRCPITDEGLDHLKGLSHLKELNLADCPITDAGLASLSGLVELEVLNLASSFGDSPRIEGHGLAALAGMTKLQVLILDKNLVDDNGLSALKNLKALKELYLEQTRVLGPGLASLRGLNQLTLLSLKETKIADAGLTGLQGVSSLEMLNLRGTLIRGEGVKHLHGLKKLHTLNLDATPLSDAGVANLVGLTGVKRLMLEGTEVSDAGLETLRQMKGLQRLAVAQTKVTEAGAAKLQAALPGVEVALK